jgi:Na+/proline symporter
MVLTYAILAKGTPIYELVSSAYQVTLVGSFIPLTAGLYWKKATTQGAVWSIVLGISLWALVSFSSSIPGFAGLDSVIPSQLSGLFGAVLGMVAGSLGPQWIGNRCHINLEHIGDLEHKHV